MLNIYIIAQLLYYVISILLNIARVELMIQNNLKMESTDAD